MKTPIVNTRVKTIVNPYDECYKTSAKTLPYKLRIDDCKLNTDDSFDVGSNNFLYIFRLEASIAAYYISFDYPKEVEDKYFFSNPKEGAGLLLSYYSSDLIDANDSYDMSQAKYLNLGIGKIQNSDWRLLNKWTVVPRLLFKGINDYVYLVISSRIKPILHVNRFPVNQPFFWDSPVATSLYSGQKLKDSSILLGVVKIITPYKHISSKEEKLNIRKYKEVVYSPHFSWKSPEKMLKVDTDKVCNVRPCKIVCNVGGRSYTNIVDVYVYHSCRNKKGNDITAFVWRSGSEDDLVKKAYLCEDYKEGDIRAYSKYPYLLDSLSLGAVYHSFASLNYSEKKVARYVIRHIARQPQGYRSISIEGYLVYIIGGALRRITDIVGNLKKKNYKEDDFKSIQALYNQNGSLLFFDNKIGLSPNGIKDKMPTQIDPGKEKDIEARNYLCDVLGMGISNDDSLTQSAPEHLREILTKIFNEIKKNNISIDYVYCDMEELFNEARNILFQRLDETFLKKLSNYHHVTSWSVYREKIYKTIYEEIFENEESSVAKKIKDNLDKLGYYHHDAPLKDIQSANSDDNPALYGMSNAKTYKVRRNINVWDVVMKNYTNEIFHDYIYKPLHEKFPKARFSVDSRYAADAFLTRAEMYETYLGGSLKLEGDMYSSIPLYGKHITIGAKKLNIENWKVLPEVTKYSFFIDHINRLRLVALSSKGKFDVFVPSWNNWAYYLNKFTSFYGKSEDETDLVMDYYKELLYHTFLMNPDKAIAYFNLDSTNTDVDYIRIDKDKYFIDSYDRLNKVLAELNNLFKGGEIEPLTKTLTAETEPFVISGVRVNGKNVWRVTFDKEDGQDCEIIMLKGGTSISKNGKTICFHGKLGNKKLQVLPEKNTLCGLWIIVPKDVFPEIKTQSNCNYYQENPAISISQDELFVRNDVLSIVDYTRSVQGKKPSNDISLVFPYNRYTVLGEIPKHHSLVLKFKLKNKLEYCCDLLQVTCNKENNVGLSLIPNSKDRDGTALCSIPVSEDGTKQQLAFKLLPGDEIYILEINIDICSITKDGDFKGEITYSLTQENRTLDDVRSVKLTWMFNNHYGNHCLFDDIKLWNYFKRPKALYQKEGGEEIPILLSELVEQELESSNVPNEEREKKEKEILHQKYRDILESVPVEIKEFCIYISGHQEKVELFRESNGLNISRVNKGVEAYTIKSVDGDGADVCLLENKFTDTIVAKVSWLNAEKEPITYVLDISVGKIEGGNVYPIDGRVLNHYIGEEDNLYFEVAPESEGYILVMLPNVHIKKNDEIKWALKQAGKESPLKNGSIVF